MSGLDVILSRLPTPPRTAAKKREHARAFRARCPNCDGHGMPLDLAETNDGRVLIHCHGCHDAAGVLGALGLSWPDVLPAAPIAHHIPGNGGPAAWGSLTGAVGALVGAHCRLLAMCAPALQRAEIKGALQALMDAGTAMQTVQTMARRAMREGSK